MSFEGRSLYAYKIIIIMKTFFLLLFFSNKTLLTDFPITIKGSPHIIYVKKPISAITDGASLLIDVSPMITDIKKKSITQLRKDVTINFNNFIIRAKLIGESNQVTLTYSGHSMISNGQVLLTLESNDKLSKLGSWSKVVISSSKQLTNVKIYWKNYSK